MVVHCFANYTHFAVFTENEIIGKDVVVYCFVDYICFDFTQQMHVLRLDEKLNYRKGHGCTVYCRLYVFYVYTEYKL